MFNLNHATGHNVIFMLKANRAMRVLDTQKLLLHNFPRKSCALMSLSQQTNKSASIVKSGFLWKRGVGVFGNSYKERLFVLKLTGKLDYFDVSSGKKILKGTILLSASSKITIRKNLPPNQQKFIIETKERQWYLWCRHNKNAKQHVEEWYNSINNMINSAKSSTKPLANDHKQTATEIAQPTATGHHLENNDTEQASGSSDELFGDYPTANDIVKYTDITTQNELQCQDKIYIYDICIDHNAAN